MSTSVSDLKLIQSNLVATLPSHFIKWANYSQLRLSFFTLLFAGTHSMFPLLMSRASSRLNRVSSIF